MEVANPASHAVATSIGKTAKNFAAIGEHIYFANETGICDYSIAGNTVTQLPLTGRSWAKSGESIPERQTPCHLRLQIHRRDRSRERGAEGQRPGRGRSRGLSADGHGHRGRRRLHLCRRQRGHRPPSSTKPARSATCRPRARPRTPWSSTASCTRAIQFAGNLDVRSAQHKPIHQAAAFPAAQNRPLDVCWDAENRLVLVVAQSDTEGGGSFWTYKPRTGAKKHFINPIDDVQLVRAVATRTGSRSSAAGCPRSKVRAQWSPSTPWPAANCGGSNRK